MKEKNSFTLPDRLDLSRNIKTKIREEFDEVLRLMDFNAKGHDIFRRWYVDGRIYYHKVIDTKGFLVRELKNYVTLTLVRLRRSENREKKKIKKLVWI